MYAYEAEKDAVSRVFSGENKRELSRTEDELKERYLEIEKLFLSKYATLSSATRGREIPVEPCPLRTEFQRDRDRIIHSKAFRRLKHKTQVFISPEGDHYRTRLTHTLEVTQIARTISTGLCLNPDLTEAIALGHDVGHTPFGHAGEEVFSRLLGVPFRHNEQSRRVVERLENDGKGLNLTWEVRDGIENHKLSLKPATLEGRVVSYSDRIAYINHDIDDAVMAGVISEDMIPKECVEVLGATKSARVNTLVLDMVNFSYDKPQVGLSRDVQYALDKLYAFMNEKVYAYHAARGEEKKAKKLLETLYSYYLEHFDEVPDPYNRMSEECGRERSVCDYLASMTDRYAVATYENLFIPNDWR